MRKLLMFAAAGLFFSTLTPVWAEDKETIEGDGMCAKCALKETKDCTNAVIVTKDGKKTTYYLEKNEFFKEAHQGLNLCQANKEAPVKVKVTGTVVKKDDKMYLTPTSKVVKVDD